MANSGLTPTDAARLATVEQKVIDIHDSQTGILEKLGSVADAVTGLTYELKVFHRDQKAHTERLNGKADKGHVNQIHDAVRILQGDVLELKLARAEESGNRDMITWIKRCIISGLVLAALIAIGVNLK